MMRSDLTELSLFRIRETERAVLVSDDGSGDSGVWLPKAAIEIEETAKQDVILVTLPERLAIEKGLV